MLPTPLQALVGASCKTVDSINWQPYCHTNNTWPTTVYSNSHRNILKNNKQKDQTLVKHGNKLFFMMKLHSLRKSEWINHKSISLLYIFITNIPTQLLIHISNFIIAATKLTLQWYLKFWHYIYRKWWNSLFNPGWNTMIMICQHMSNQLIILWVYSFVSVSIIGIHSC